MIRDLVRHSAVYTVASLFTRVMVFVWVLVLPYFLDNEQYGFLGLLTTFATLFSTLFTLEISQALARYVPATPPAERPPMVSTGWQFTLVGSIVAFAALMLAAPALAAEALGSTRFLVPLKIGFGWLVLNTLFIFLQNQLRWEFRAGTFLIASTIFAVASITLSIGFAASFTNPLAGVMVGQLVSAGIALTYCLTALWPNLWARLDSTWLKRLLKFSLPLVPASLSLFACAYANRLILADTLGLGEVGLFTWANQLSSIPAILVIGIQSAITPLIIRHHEDAETPARLARAFEMVFVGGLLACLALVIGSPLLINLLGYEQFAAAPLLIALSAPGLFLLQLYVFFPGFAIAKRTELQLLASIIGALSVLATYPLVAAYGVTGAAIGALISGFVFLTAWILLSRRYYPVPVRWGRLALLAATTGIAITLTLSAMTSGGALIVGVASFTLLIAAAAGLNLVRVRELRHLASGLRG